jgi:mannitol/fructose-specific phosphotransferase system IIA component (Ntr-type)
MKIVDLVSPTCVIPELPSEDRNGALRELVESIAGDTKRSAEWADSVFRSIIARERTRGTTGIGRGVAMPHAKVPGFTGVVGAIGRSSRGIDFASLDGAPVFVVFLIVSPEEDTTEHLKAMDLVFRLLQRDQFRKFMRQADSVDRIMDLIRDEEEALA